jgi:hypothetical protein
MANIGCIIAQRLTMALSGLGISYEKRSKVIYGEFLDISNEMDIGDWLEFPDGTTFELTYKPKKEENHE